MGDEGAIALASCIVGMPKLEVLYLCKAITR
jgi:hypothetical protein